MQRIAEHRALLRELEQARAQLARGRRRGRPSSAVAGRCCGCSTGSTPSRPARRAGADHRRERHRQGAGGARPARGGAAPRHARSWRSTARRFPETLLEAELFGHERGAFTGARQAARRPLRGGRRRHAVARRDRRDAAAAQAKLLRVLQEGTFEPLGTNDACSVDVRVISATHRDLKERIADGLFREDLYYRLNVLNSTSRRCASARGPAAAGAVLPEAVRPAGQAPSRVSPAAWAALSAFLSRVTSGSWPRHRARGGAGGRRRHRPAAPAARHRRPPDDAGRIETRARPLGTALKEFERDYLQRALPRRRASARWPPRSWASPARTCGRSCACTASAARAGLRQFRADRRSPLGRRRRTRADHVALGADIERRRAPGQRHRVARQQVTEHAQSSSPAEEIETTKTSRLAPW